MKRFKWIITYAGIGLLSVTKFGIGITPIVSENLENLQSAKKIAIARVSKLITNVVMEMAFL